MRAALFVSAAISLASGHTRGRHDLRSAQSAAPSTASTATPSPVRTSVHWTITRHSAGCFFFTGPGELGRDNHLGTHATLTRDGTNVTLRFGPGIAFAGPDVQGATRLTRHSVHDFGSKWEATETIELTATGSTWSGRYHYSECDTTQPASCPGTCTIDASFTMTR